MKRIHLLVSPVCGALVAGVVAGVPAAASEPNDLSEQRVAATTDGSKAGLHCWGSVQWSAGNKLNERYWKVSPKNRWRPDDHNTTAKKLGFVPRTFVYYGAAGGDGFSQSTDIVISKRRAVFSVTTSARDGSNVLGLRKSRIGRLKGKARPMNGMSDLYLVRKSGRVVYAPNAGKPNKRVRVRGLRLRNYRFGAVSSAQTKNGGYVNVMYAVRGSRLVRVVLNGRKVIRAPRVVSKTWRNAKGLTARPCVSSHKQSIVRIGKNRKARGFLHSRPTAKRPAKLGKGVKLGGRYRGRAFGA
ncbi:hypothetical protein MU582_17080 [Nocardioidaceae bacterium SCSIO 66511]|nr:hypothetical protein MU582_17080 [Nocardioidaceae bacterium SCSIO 66511]